MMQADETLQVTPPAAESANVLTGAATVEFAARVPEQSALATAQGAADAVHAASMWAPSVSASAGVSQQVPAAAAALAPHGGAVAQCNSQSLAEDLETDTQNAQDLTPHPAVSI
ncbi:hypothetical protein H7I55_16475 [Mycolicibacterium setense]|uniref:Uncharacterized protein n=1 Tax=Mycobacterium marinum DL240490 TaxID=459420 RepID=B6CLN3_MYCMR|nr:hypothetical protein MUDP_044 [Mycobacterium marinum DL240490]MCV7112559.1 hypothetical protein [Mycolicibacterium setense]